MAWLEHWGSSCAAAAAAAAKSLQSCPTLCGPHRWQPTRLLHVLIVFK